METNAASGSDEVPEVGIPQKTEKSRDNVGSLPLTEYEKWRQVYREVNRELLAERGNSNDSRRVLAKRETTSKPHNRRRHRRRHGNKKRDKKRGKKNVTVHIEADNSGQHMPFNGIFDKWKPADWTTRRNEKIFELDTHSGRVTIKTKGLFLIYAQITFIGSANQGFIIQRERSGIPEPLASCFTAPKMSPYNHHVTCSTTSVVKLQYNDVIYIASNSDYSKAYFNASASFFGLLNLK